MDSVPLSRAGSTSGDAKVSDANQKGQRNTEPVGLGSKILGGIGLALVGISIPFTVFKTITDPAYENYKLPVYGSIGVISFCLGVAALIDFMNRNKAAKAAGMAVGAGGLILLLGVLGVAGICWFIGALSTAPAWVAPMFLLYLWTRPRK